MADGGAMTLKSGNSVGILGFLVILILSFVTLTYANNHIPNNKKVDDYFMASSRNKNANIYPNQISHTAKYQEAAKYFSESIDTSVNPCDNFYQYACGNYNKSDSTFEIAKNDNYKKMADAYNIKNENDSLPIKQVKKMYHQCMSDYSKWDVITADGEIILSIVDDFMNKTKLKFPLLDDKKQPWPHRNATSFALGYLKGMYGPSLFDYSIDVNSMDPQGSLPYILSLNQPILSQGWSYYNGKALQKTKPVLTKRVYDLLMGYINITQAGVNPNDVKEVAKNIVEFEYLLENDYSSINANSDKNLYISLQDFNSTFSSLNIFILLQQIAIKADEAVKTKLLDPNYVIWLDNPESLKQINQGFTNGFNDKITADTFVNYLFYRLLDANKDYFPTGSIEYDAFLDRYQAKPSDRLHFQNGIRTMSQKAKKSLTLDEKMLKCVGETVEYFSFANARVFIDAIYPKQADRDKVKNSMTYIVDSILIGMESMVDQISWMSSYSKKGAYSKIQNLVRNIVYPDWITDDQKLSTYYQDLDEGFMNASSYKDMKDYISIFRIKLDFNMLLKNNGTDRFDWGRMGSGLLNAWYQPELNSITIPAAILHQPFFDPEWPASVNYGAMGVIAGHELSHGFDNYGVKFDAFGQFATWLDPISQQYFNNMTECVIEEYSRFCPLDPSKYQPNCVNGQQTAGENIADNSGIHAAFQAYRNTINFRGSDPLLPGDLISLFNHDQLFFLSFAQSWCELHPSPDVIYGKIIGDFHSPSKYRVFGTIENFPAFRNAFNCPIGSNSAPANHCNVWISDVNISLAKEQPPSNDLNIRDFHNIKADEKLYTKYNEAQAFFQNSMNFSINPCEKFYDYACGSTKKLTSFDIVGSQNDQIMVQQMETLITPGYEGELLTSTSINKTIRFYKECKKTIAAMKSPQNIPEIRNGEIVKTILDDFEKLTSYKNNFCDMTHSNKNSDPKLLAKAMAYLSIEYWTDTLVTPTVEINAKRDENFNFNYSLTIDQNFLTYRKPYYQNGTWEKYTKNALKSNMLKLFQNYFNSIKMDCNDNALEYNVNQMVDFEHALAINYSVDDTTRRNFSRFINPITVGNISYGFVDWATYVNELSTLTGTNFIDSNFVENYWVQISEPEMLAKLDDFISKIDFDIVAKYLYYRLLLSQQRFVYSPKNSSYITLYQKSVHISRKIQRKDPYASKIDEADVEITCVGDLNYLFNTYGRIFTEALYPTPQAREYIRNETLKVIIEIKNSMESMLEDLPWIKNDPKALQGARDKIQNLKINAVYPDFILNNTLLDEYHEFLKFGENDNYFLMLKKLYIFNYYQEYISLTNSKFNDMNSFGAASAVNAWYDPTQNSITIPGGILRQPFFDPRWPASIKFGALGIVIGHEITHGFDDEGVQWNSEGILETWMSDASQRIFEEMAECVIDEYGNFTAIQNISYSPRNLNGQQTQGENIADNGGIHSSYNSYRRWVSLNGPDPQLPDRIFGQLTHDQLFFLSFAQPWCEIPPKDDDIYYDILTDEHSPSKYRIFGTLQNFPAFRSAFNCPLNSAYAPSKHCSVWVPNS